MKSADARGPSMRYPTVSVNSSRCGTVNGVTPQAVAERHGLVRRDDRERDVTVGDEQAPGPVGRQVVGHAARSVHPARRTRPAPSFPRNIKPRVMADVAVGQEDPVRRRAAGQRVELGRHVRGWRRTGRRARSPRAPGPGWTPSPRAGGRRGRRRRNAARSPGAACRRPGRCRAPSASSPAPGVLHRPGHGVRRYQRPRQQSGSRAGCQRTAAGRLPSG